MKSTFLFAWFRPWEELNNGLGNKETGCMEYFSKTVDCLLYAYASKGHCAEKWQPLLWT